MKNESFKILSNHTNKKLDFFLLFILMMSLHFLRSKILVQKTMEHQMNCKFAVCLRASASTNNNKKGCDAFSTEFLWKELNQSIDLEIVFFFCLEIASFVVDSEVRKKKKSKSSKGSLKTSTLLSLLTQPQKKSLMIFLRCQFHCYLATHFKPSTHHHIEHSREFQSLLFNCANNKKWGIWWKINWNSENGT